MTGKEEKDLTATTTPPPEAREQKPVEMPQETKDELLEQSLESLASNKNLNPQLGDAIGMTQRWQERHEKNLQDVKKICFKDNDEMFKEWNARNANSYIKHRDSLIRYEQSQVRQLIKVQNEENRKRLEEGSRSATIMANNASLSELAEKRHSIQSEYEGELNTTKKQWEEFRSLKDREVKEVAEAVADDPELAGRLERATKNELGEKALEYQKREEIIQSKKDTALAAAKKEYDDQMTANRETLRKWYTDSLAKETKFQMSRGYDEKTAFMLAVSEIGKDSQAMLEALVDAGQGDFVQTFLDEIGTGEAGLKKVQRMQDGKPVKDENGKDVFDWEWNPNGRLCMSLSQVNEVKKYLTTKVTTDINSKRLVQKQQEDVWDLAASKIRSEINQMDVMPTLDMARVQQLYAMANELSAQGYKKAHLVTANISSVVNEHANRERALQAREQKAAAAKTKELGDIAFKKMIDEYAASPDGVFTVEMMLPDDKGNPVLTKVEMNANNAIAHTIATAQSLGFLKGDAWTKRMGDALAVEEQRKVVETVINGMFDFPVKKSVSVRDNGSLGWGDRAEGSSTFITVGLGDNSSLKAGNVGSNMRVRSKVASTKEWFDSSKQRYLTSDQLNVVIREAHRFVKDNPAATVDSLMTHLAKVRDNILLDSDKETFGTKMALATVKANDDYFTRDVYGGRKNGKVVLARGRKTVGEMISLSAMNARFNPAYTALTKNAIIFGDDEEPDTAAMQDEASEEREGALE